MQIYNTLTKKQERFKPLKQEQVKVYFCGPTVYNYAHIGNLRTFVFEDYVIKTLRFLGYKVVTTMNLTDIDDKTIRDSQKAGETLLNFTRKYTEIFLQDIEKLNIKKADNIVPISDLIDEMVFMINKLIAKGFAYLGDDGSIYYDIKKFKKYGNLAHLDFSGMKESVRIDNDEYDKENAADFVLWKAWKKEDGENFWEKEFVFPSSVIPAKAGISKGDEVDPRDKHEDDKIIILKGRPGWHIECSACNMKYFGPQIDIHMGGVDLIFPHHQNEIAQSEACTGKEFSKYWIHSGHLLVDGKKMSKSAGNFYTLRDLEEKFKDVNSSVLYRSIRLSFMNSKYAESVDFSFSKVEQSINTIKKIDEALKKLDRAIKSGKLEDLKVRRDFREEMQIFIGEYIEKLEDDFNMPESLSVFFNFITFSNTQIDGGELCLSEANSLLDMYKIFDEVLGIFDFEVLESEEILENIKEIFEERNLAKKEKNFEKADKLRDELLDLGYKIIDDRNGSRVERL